MSKKKSTEFKRMLNDYFSVNPKEVNGINNMSFLYYRKLLYQIVYSRFNFVDFPKNWDKDYFRDVLFQEGVISICKTKLGVLALRGGYSGVNVYEKPTDMIIANPVLGGFTRTIGVDCTPLYFEYFNKNYSNIEMIIRRYALLLSQIEASFNTTLFNSRVAMMFTSSSKSALKTAQSLYDKVSQGEPALFMLEDNENELSTKPYFNNVKQSYIGNELLITRQTIINDFCTFIGINNANTQKRERLNTDEVNANNEMTYTLVNLWIDNMNECFDRARELFPEIKTRVELNREEVDVNEFISGT